MCSTPFGLCDEKGRADLSSTAPLTIKKAAGFGYPRLFFCKVVDFFGFSAPRADRLSDKTDNNNKNSSPQTCASSSIIQSIVIYDKIVYRTPHGMSTVFCVPL